MLMTPARHKDSKVFALKSTFLFSLFLLLLILIFPVKSYSQVNIHSIQTNLPNSPFLNSPVTTRGIVIAVLSDGFYIENASVTCTTAADLNCWDNSTDTAEGIFVYTPSAVPVEAAVGNLLEVTGMVKASNSSSYAGTQLEPSTAPTLISNNNSIPNLVPAAELAAVATGRFGQWLQFQGMRISLPSLTTTSATGGSLNEATAAVTSNGQFWGVLTSSSGTTTRPFRETGISQLEKVPAGAPTTVSRWDGNPELLLIDTGALDGTPLDITANQVITNIVGIVDYHIRPDGYTAILTDKSNGYGGASNASTPIAAPQPKSGQLTVATQDLGRLFGSSAVTAAAYSRRLAKIATAIVQYENLPDLIAVQNVQGLQPMADLITAVNNVATSQGKTSPNYTSYFQSGNDNEGFGNSYLIKGSVIDIAFTEMYGKDISYTTLNGTTEPLFARPPIVLHLGVLRPDTSEYPITVLIADVLNRTNIGDSTLGANIRAKREAQAEYIAKLAQVFQSNGERVITLGNFNAFEFSDGYVDTLGGITGNPVASTLVTLASLNNLTSPNLVNLTKTVDATSRYTYVENGSAEQTDHILISNNLAAQASVGYARVNADFPKALLNDSSPFHNAEHDPVIAYFTIPQATILSFVSSANPSYFTQNVTFTATASSSAGGIPTGNINFYDGATLLASVTLDASGVATYSTTTLAVGTHTITAKYAGDAGHESASASIKQVVNPLIPTKTTLSCSPSPTLYATTVTCTATVTGSTGVPTGSITFLDGTTTLSTIALTNGVATYTTNSLSIGLHSITASYPVTIPYDASGSNTAQERIYAEFDLAVSPSSGSIYTGEGSDFTLTVTPGAGFTFTVPLACGTLPNESSCVFSPSSIANGSGTAKWTIQTTAPTQTVGTSNSSSLPWQLPAGAGAAVGLALCFLPKKLRRRAFFLGSVLMAFLAIGSGCSAPRKISGGTTPGTYTVTVTASVDEAGYTVSHSANITLTVKSLFKK